MPPDDPKGQSQGQPGTTAPATQYTRPDKFKTEEDLYKSYQELEGKLGNWKETEARAAVAAKLDQYGGFDNLLQWATYGYQGYQQKQQTSPVTAQQPAWEEMTPQEQQQAIQAAVWKQTEEYANRLAQLYAQRAEQFQQNLSRQWDLFRMGMEMKVKDPALDLNALMEAGVKVATLDSKGLLELAAKSLTGDRDGDARAKALFEQWKADDEQKRKNQELQVLGAPSRAAYTVPEMPKTKSEESELVLKNLINAGVITPGHV